MLFKRRRDLQKAGMALSPSLFLLFLLNAKTNPEGNMIMS